MRYAVLLFFLLHSSLSYFQFFVGETRETEESIKSSWNIFSANHFFQLRLVKVLSKCSFFKLMDLQN